MANQRMVFRIYYFAGFVAVIGICRADLSLEGSSTLSPAKASGKTYFVQLKKVLPEDSAEGASSYVKINHYNRNVEGGNMEIKEETMIKKKFGELIKEIPQNFEVIDAENADSKQSPSLIDPEWSFNPDRTIYDLPNITHEIYDAMLEHNKHNTRRNASTVKFFFETDTNLNSNIIKFNIESLLNVSDKIVDCELHVYRLPRKENTTFKADPENVVRLYQMTDNITEKSPDVHKLVNVIYISSKFEGWQVFKVKQAVENWRSGDHNLGFLISTVDSKDKEDQLVEFAHRHRNGGKYQPMLIVYLTQNIVHHSKKKTAMRRKHKSKYVLNPCKRRVRFVSFHELGWNNFVIAPGGFMAYQCEGSCQSPAVGTFSNHAKMLNILRKSKACCVPSNYRNLLVMFYDNDSNVIIKEYEDMIVESCGCK